MGSVHDRYYLPGDMAGNGHDFGGGMGGSMGGGMSGGMDGGFGYGDMVTLDKKEYTSDDFPSEVYLCSFSKLRHI